MNRLEKKCVIVSAGTHLLLALILFVGPAFVSSGSKPKDLQIIDFIPMKVVDADVAGGGDPKAKPPPAPPEPVAPKPVSPPAPAPDPPQPKPEPKPEPAKPPEPQPIKDPDAFDPPKKRKPVISTTLVTRKPAQTTPKTKSTAESDAQERKANENRRRLAGELAQMSRSLGDKSSSVTTVGIYGPGGGGETYAGYDQVVQSKYFHAWVAPEDIAKDNAIAKATVTIAKDGTVLSARILTSSGDANMDKSVQRTLDRVTFISPFPEGAKENQRTYTIVFDLKAKRLT